MPLVQHTGHSGIAKLSGVQIALLLNLDVLFLGLNWVTIVQLKWYRHALWFESF
jgi:hypothetical protein